MCFGSSKDKDIFDAEGPRPSYHQPQQPSYASAPKASIPPAQAQSYQQPQKQQAPLQQYQQPAAPVAELSGDNDFTPPPDTPPSHMRHQDDISSVGPPPGPPPSQSNNPFRRNNDDYAPPPGPPPSHQAGPVEDYAPPPGPPPSQRPITSAAADYAQPPPGPPPSHDNKKPEHDWQSLVPDTSLFPPPPSFFSGFERSPATNATEAEAEAGEQWCRDHPLRPPLFLDEPAVDALRAHNFRLMEPTPNFRGSLTWRAPGVWQGHTTPQALDSCIIGYPPMYAVTQHSPLAPTSISTSPAGSKKKTIYYEIAVAQDGGRGDVCLAMGYTALPYPSFRMPGWHRGSLAVHGDDGHKFINDRWGGKSFTEPFRRGETYGIGMSFENVQGAGKIEVWVFLTRGGREVGRWNLHEEGDSEQDLPVTGLEGFHDLSCAIGAYTGVTFEVVFDPKKWLFRPEGY